MHTGDIAYYDENGEFFIVDRLKETLKYRGFQISPSEIENLLQSHPDVVEVAVVGIPHLQDDEHPIAFITKVPGSKVRFYRKNLWLKTSREFSYLLHPIQCSGIRTRVTRIGGKKYDGYLPFTRGCEIFRKNAPYTFRENSQERS